MPKKRKQEKRPVGRPKLAEHQAKAKIVPVRFSAVDFHKIEAAASANDQTVSQWIRSTLHAAING